MKTLIRKTLLTAVFLAVAILPPPTAEAAPVYFNGPLIAVSEERVEIPAGSYRIVKGAKVVIRERSSSGAYYEKTGHASELRPGETVYVKTSGSKAYEILVVR